MLQSPLKTNLCQNFTRDKILVCKTRNMKWTKSSPEVNEFPSHSLGKEPGFSLLCFTGFHGRLFQQGQHFSKSHSWKSCSVSSRARQSHDGVTAQARVQGTPVLAELCHWVWIDQLFLCPSIWHIYIRFLRNTKSLMVCLSNLMLQ